MAMRKKLRLASPEVVPRVFDWSKCCLCQQPGQLICPAEHRDPKQRNAGYKTLSENLIKFKEIGLLPNDVKIEEFDEGEGIQTTFEHHQARWHKQCTLKYNTKNLERAIQRSQSCNQEITNRNEALFGESSCQTRRASQPTPRLMENICFLCNKGPLWNQPLTNVATMGLDKYIREKKTLINNTKLHALMEGTDLIALEGKYHVRCMVNLRNKVRSVEMENQGQHNGGNTVCHAIAFAHVASFISDKLASGDTEYIFCMSTISKMYSAKLMELAGLDEPPEVHTTRLRERVIYNFPNLRTEKKGKEYILVRDSANIFQSIPHEDSDADAIAAQRFILRLREEMFRSTTNFNGSFDTDCQKSSVPASLLATVNLLLYGSTEVKDRHSTQPALSISQLIFFNHRKNVPSGNQIRQKTTCEPPLCIFKALSTYGRTRDKSIVNEDHNLGLSISYNRLSEITSELCQDVVNRSKKEGVFCPANFKEGLFTVSAYDNIDHNLSSSTSETTFHGTSISMYQLPTPTNTGTVRLYEKEILPEQLKSKKDVPAFPTLPEFYSLVKTAVLPCATPQITSPVSEDMEKKLINEEGVKLQWLREKEWLNHVNNVRVSESCSVPLNISWSGFHATEADGQIVIPAIQALLPLFTDKSSSVSMLRHAINITMNITKHVNPTQVPVIAMDQPLYTLAKVLQWNWPDMYGENHIFILFGQFHIELAFLKLIGQSLNGSGWSYIIANSGLMSETSALACMTVTHVKKTRTIHQVTACSLYSLLILAYNNTDKDLDLQKWVERRSSESPTFLYWMTVLNIEILLLTFVYSIRMADYTCFKETLKKMIPWFFIFDHFNYARWLSIHMKDLEELSDRAEKVNEEFLKGNFVIRKTKKPFSAIAVDQAHEQQNAVIKGEGGAIGLFHDANALMRWALAGPEITRLIDEFCISDVKCKQNLHHEQYESYQKKFLKKTKMLTESFLEVCNPFEEMGSDLISLHTQVVASSDRVVSLQNLEEDGKILYRTFIKERLSKNRSISVFSPIKLNKKKLLADMEARAIPRHIKLVKTLKNDVQLFSKLFIAAQHREMDLNSFFQHENQAYPPSLSVDGGIRACGKSELTRILETVSDKGADFTGQCDAIIFDGATVINMLPPRTSKTFGEYFRNEFQQFTAKVISNMTVKRVDFVWDIYSEDSIKKPIQEQRGIGVRRQVTEGNLVPKNWPTFLRNDKNKEELFGLLARGMVKERRSFEVVTNDGETFISSSLNTTLHGTFLMQEADGRIILHIVDTVAHGAVEVMIRTVDTDVLVLSVSYYYYLKKLGLKRLWIMFGVGNRTRHISVHNIAEALGEDKSVALRGFHAFTGCDTTSSFSSNGKKSAWNAWKKFEDVTSSFLALSHPMEHLSPELEEQFQQFVVLLYSTECAGMSINEARKFLFSSRSRLLENVPPTSAALQKHILRAAYQGGHVWGQSHLARPILPPPSEWGWVKNDDKWTPLWTSLPPIWESCRELVRCNCKEGCKSRCSCKNIGVSCTLLCKHCKGKCLTSSDSTVVKEKEEEK